MSLELKEKFCRPIDERIVLSFCFKKIDYFYDLASKVTERDFLYPDHQLLFMMMKGMVDQGVTTIDASIILSQAQAGGLLEAIGGVGYIQSIINIEASLENFNKYLFNVIEASTKYKTYINIRQHMLELESNSHEGKTSVDLINSIESDMLDMGSKSIHNEDAIELGSTLTQFIEEKKDKRVEMSGLATGYPILDKQVDGMIPGTLMVIAARKKMGKSAFLTNIGTHVSYNLQVPVLYIDTELTFGEWRTRSLAKISQVKERDIKHGGYSSEQLKKLQIANKKMSNGKFFHKYMPGYSVDKVAAICKKYKIKENIGLIIFDYIKEPDLSSTDGTRKEHQLLGDITTKLKDLAGVLDIPVLTAVQLNRANDIADSDRIARYGDIIAMWSTRTEDEKLAGGADCGNFKLCIKDTRRGGSTIEQGIGYWFFKEYLDIKEVKPSEQFFINPKEEVSNSDDADDARYKKELGTEIL